MSMYVEILSRALDDQECEMRTCDSLLDAANDCRAQMLDCRIHKWESAESRIACEIAYDRALINLCVEMDIDVSADRFSHPNSERERLERALARLDIRLTSPGSADSVVNFPR